ncbi:MAG: hypothetical protein AAF355_09640 [Myxococcota bacterium]
MPDRKQFQTALVVDSELEDLLERAKKQEISEDDLREQRVSFAYGNAPLDSDGITKDSVRQASTSIRLKT